VSSFSDFQLLPTLLESLAEKKLKVPTEIQSRAIPLMLQNKSVVGISQTGSGKTLAFSLPILHMIKSLELAGDDIQENAKPRAAIIVPSRDLGEQVSKVLKLFTHNTRLRVRTLLGGTTLEVAKKNISGTFEILIATPGRLVQLWERDLINLDDVRVLVFDEADQMLDPGFLSEAKKIASACSEDKQMALFSATISLGMQKLMTELFSGAEILKTEGSHKVVSTLKTVNQTVVDGKRMPVLEKILAQPVTGGTLIFTNTREQCDKLAEELHQKGYKCLIYRGEMDKVERRSNLKAFRDGKADLLVSTDLAARGLDVDHVGRVINYHLPKEMENYLHRAGRTARAGRKGTVINLVTERDSSLIQRLKT